MKNLCKPNINQNLFVFPFVQQWILSNNSSISDSTVAQSEQSSTPLAVKSYLHKINKWCFLMFKCEHKKNQDHFSLVNVVRVGVFSSCVRVSFVFLCHLMYILLLENLNIVIFLFS
jgi:hypothetical protein